MRLFFSIALTLTLSTAFASDNQFTAPSENLQVSKIKSIVVTPTKNATDQNTLSLRSLPLPTENKHQFRYLFKRFC